MTAYWLIKSEPDAFSWDQQVENGTEPWTGVRSHQAKNNLAAMKTGDRAFFYHSNIGKAIVGIVEVARAAYPDPSADEGTPWLCVDMKAVSPLPRAITLAEIKADPVLAGIALVKFSRLSVAPITAAEWDYVTALSQAISPSAAPASPIALPSAPAPAQAPAAGAPPAPSAPGTAAARPG